MLIKTYKPFSVVVVPFPFTDKEKSKRRPALVISSESHQKKSSHITLLMITTAQNSSWFTDHKITDIDNAGLPVPSIVRQKIFTIDAHLILSELGELGMKDRKAVLKMTHEHLAI